MFCDSHTHLDQFSDIEVGEIVTRANDEGVEIIVAVGSTFDSSRRALCLAERFPSVYAGVGLHPMDLNAPFCDDDYELLRGLALSHPKVVCISETGLDYLPTSPDRGWQEASFREHIRLARDVKKPLDFHSRDANDVILGVLHQEKVEEVGAIWHYFQGDQYQADEALGMGLYLSLAKPLLRLEELQRVAKSLPMERIVLETDSYPQPWKKNPAMRTEPAHVIQVAQKIAELKELTIGDVAAATTANLKRVLSVW